MFNENYGEVFEVAHPFKKVKDTVLVIFEIVLTNLRSQNLFLQKWQLLTGKQ